VIVDWLEPTTGVSIAVDASDNVYTVYYEYNLGEEITLTKRDVNGNFLWEASYDQTDPTKWEKATWVTTDNENNILVSGTLMSGYSNPVNAASILMKFTPTGNMLWRQVYESSFDGSYTRKCLVDASNNIYVLGMGSGPAGYVTKIKKFAPNGSAVWSYFDSDGIGAPVNFKFTPDSAIVIAGRAIYGSINGYAKIDLNGNKIWSYPGVYSLTVGDASSDIFGNTYLVHGEYVSNPGTMIKKISPSGTLLWENVYTLSGFRIEVGTDNCAVVSGYPNQGTPGAAFIKVNESGDLLWANLDADGPLALMLHARMLLDQDNDVYLAAGTLFEMAVCKVNNDGTSAWTQTLPGSYANDITLGNNGNSLFVVGLNTARLIWNSSTNSPPLTGSPNPINGSTGQPLSLTWSIPIYDPEGDLFSWTIQCSNGQTNNAIESANGTKTLALSGLAYSTTYKIWVNATDPIGSGLTTRRWYTFTTKVNLPPVLGTPSPANGSTNNPLNFIWSIPISDPEGNTFTWTIHCNNGQTNSESGATNGTKTLTLSGLTYATMYKIWVNATDPTGSGQYTRRWYRFTTAAENQPPFFGQTNPANGSTNQPLNLTLSIPISDAQGDLFTWSIQCSNGQTNSGDGASNGTKTLALTGLTYATTYTIWVNATDPTGSGQYTREWFIFTTINQQQNTPPNKPETPTGTINGKINILYTYTTSSTDPDSEQVYYNWSWGDGTYSGWLGPFTSGAPATAQHEWTTKGSYEIKVKAKDTHGDESPWSNPLFVALPTTLNYPMLRFLEQLFEWFPNAFLLLRHLMGC
ncbi:MAG TPA: hypothetical protein VN365_07625, partial [Candidatus Thermoplasmatota archaeon]|nr:hypothetical protein [Candidatus Thermoplasmatota archaeon]